MIVLAFDTCFDACSAAVAIRRADGRVDVSGEQQLMATGQAEALMPMIARVMAAAGVTMPGITRLAVTHGPGTFTGTRITVAAARGFQLALGVPAVELSSTRAIALGALARLAPLVDDGSALLVARDAKRGEVYAEVVANDGASLTGPRLLPVADAAQLCAHMRLLAVGSAAQMVAAAARDVRRGAEVVVVGPDRLPAALLEPDARCFAAWALGAHATRTPVGPVYVRAPDAKPPQSPAVPRRAVERAGDV